eukprot:gene11537-21762_t
MDDTIEAALNSVLEHDEESFEELCQNLSVLSPREMNFSNGTFDIKPQQNGFHEHGEREMQSRPARFTDLLNVDDEGLEDISTEELAVGLCVESQMAYALDNRAFVPKDINKQKEEGKKEIHHSEANMTGKQSSEEKIALKAKTNIPTNTDFDTMNTETESSGSKEIDTSSQNSPFKVMVLNKIAEQDKLPGEATEDVDSAGFDIRPQITNIEIKTTSKSKSPPESPSSSEAFQLERKRSSEPDVCSDDIEEFKLDENFDYDNVDLTPHDWFYREESQS